ncbi:MAG: hypothetical protein KAV45_10980 [Calditrichia bacterium]|nr:hypothetical protein [Calditrichia bacterium]
MTIQPQEISLDISPEYRFEIIDITNKISELINGDKNRYQKTTYCSFHTTAGYLDQNLCSRLNHQKEKIRSYITAFQQLFPINANYRHDVMELRNELSEAERQVEPKNADSHLTFIGSGLRNCVTYRNNPDTPVYFIELDGVSEHGHRTRQTNAMFYNDEEVVFQQKIRVPLSRHPIDSINLRDPKLGYLEKLNEILSKYEIENGRIDINLDPIERFAGLTVNEYETLLMTHDLVQVLRNPMKFMGEKGKYLLQHPSKIPTRTKEYAKYDFVQIFNELMDSFGMSQSVFEKLLARVIALPAEKFLSLKRNISFLISNNGSNDTTKIVQGRYQSPILVQWKESPSASRALTLTITRYK